MNVCILKMLYFDRIEVSEEIDVNKTSDSEMCDICHYFLTKSFKFQPNVCNRYHDLLMMSMNISYIAILNINSADYLCIISGISKNEAINLMQNANSTKKSKRLKNINNLFSYIKMDKEFLKFGDIETEKNKCYHRKTPIF